MVNCSVANAKVLVWPVQALVPGKVSGRKLKCRQHRGGISEFIGCMQAPPLGGEFHRVGAESEAQVVGTRSTAPAPQTSGLHFISTYPHETARRHQDLCFLLPKRNNPQFSKKKEGNVELRYLTSVSYIHHRFWICTRSLGKKKHQL